MGDGLRLEIHQLWNRHSKQPGDYESINIHQPHPSYQARNGHLRIWMQRDPNLPGGPR